MQTLSQHVPEEVLSQISNVVAKQVGLNFPPDRFSDLERGLLSAAREQNVESPLKFATELLLPAGSRRLTEFISGHLTVGETYFFRQKQLFDALEQRILPELIARRRDGCRVLRLWSAGCSTGEEPYSLALLLLRLIPVMSDWSVTILGTDLNARSLEIAREGVFGKWSFRGVPDLAGTCYFSPTVDGRWSIADSARRLVRFVSLNLAAGPLPEFALSMDVILCRNVLMYLTPKAADHAIEGFRHALTPRGWLAVSPAETSDALSSHFTTVLDSGMTLYRTEPRIADSSVPLWAGAATPATMRAVAEPSAAHVASPAREQVAQDDPLRQAREFADKGKLQEALRECDKTITGSRADARTLYFRAAILSERGLFDDAIRSLHRALCLDPQFVIVYFLLGTIYARLGNQDHALKHFRAALAMLATSNSDDIVPESGGLAAGRLRDLIRNHING